MKQSTHLALRFLLSCLGGLIVVVVGCIMIYSFLFSQDWAQGFAFTLIVGLIPIVNSPVLFIALLIPFSFSELSAAIFDGGIWDFLSQRPQPLRWGIT
jgi:hypothetical protein